MICQANGKLIKPPYFSKNFTNMIKQHKLKKIRFHDLRHSCASLMLRSGVAMKTASQILGHSTIGITADLYTHVLEDTKKEAAIQIGKELFKEK
ncbi:MAG: tyrosine-type recombinase/integrase [Negativicutes bacterium]|nr:tyrosine-type recombinase/integrase [Negativicutes bacterium]